VLFGWIRRRRAAARRADALVRRVLTEAERSQLRREGFFEVRSGLMDGRTYRIPPGGAAVASLEPDGRVEYLCLQPETQVPRSELVVVHKLLLEGAEAEYRARANRVGRPMGMGRTCVLWRPLLY
jgi:hypothetical protein